MKSIGKINGAPIPPNWINVSCGVLSELSIPDEVEYWWLALCATLQTKLKDELTENDKALLTIAGTPLAETDYLFVPYGLSYTDFSKQPFINFVNTMVTWREVSESQSQNPFRLIHKINQIWEFEGSISTVCQRVSAVFEHCKEVQEQLSARSFPPNDKAQRAAGDKFDVFQEFNYIFALSDGEPKAFETVKKMPIGEAVLSLFYQSTKSHYEHEYSKIVSGAKGNG